MQRKHDVLHSFLMAKRSLIKTVVKFFFAVAKLFFIRTSADKRVSVVIYNSSLSLVIARLIENNGGNSL